MFSEWKLNSGEPRKARRLERVRAPLLLLSSWRGFCLSRTPDSGPRTPKPLLPLLLLALFVSTLVPTPAACAEEMTSAELRDSLRECREWTLRKSKARRVAKAPSTPAECAPLKGVVCLSDAHTDDYCLDLRYLRSAYREAMAAGDSKKRAERLKDFAATLDFLDDSLRPGAALKPGRNFARDKAALDSILASEEFAKNKPKKRKSFLDGFYDWFGKLIRRISEVISDLFPDSFGVNAPPAIVPIGKALLILAALFLVVVIVMNVSGEARGRGRRARGAEGEATGVGAARGASAESILAEAERMAGRGRHRDAVRAVYQSFVRGLDEAGLVRYVENKTNREYMTELEGRSGKSGSRERLNRIFEDVWYGMDPAAADEYETSRRLREVCLKELKK